MGFKIDGISFYYQEKKVIDDLSVTLAPGRFYGIVGPNGCGKSTLIDILVKHRKPAAGTVSYRGKDIRRYSRKKLSTEIALVPQNFYINFPFTAREIIMMGRYPHIPRFSSPAADDLAVVEQIMAQTGTDAFENRLITELSGGERQRVVFARALTQNTPVLILDEATSNLDINHTLSLLNIAARRVAKDGHTVIAVFQDLNLAAIFCDALIFMQQGRVVAAGDLEDVLNGNTIQTLFGVEAKVYFEPFANARQVVFKR